MADRHFRTTCQHWFDHVQFPVAPGNPLANKQKLRGICLFMKPEIQGNNDNSFKEVMKACLNVMKHKVDEIPTNECAT